MLSSQIRAFPKRGTSRERLLHRHSHAPGSLAPFANRGAHPDAIRLATDPAALIAPTAATLAFTWGERDLDGAGVRGHCPAVDPASGAGARAELLARRNADRLRQRPQRQRPGLRDASRGGRSRPDHTSPQRATRSKAGSPTAKSLPGQRRHPRSPCAPMRGGSSRCVLDRRGADELLFDDFGDEGDAASHPTARRLLFTREGSPWWRRTTTARKRPRSGRFDRDDKTFTRLLDPDTGRPLAPLLEAGMAEGFVRRPERRRAQPPRAPGRVGRGPRLDRVR